MLMSRRPKLPRRRVVVTALATMMALVAAPAEALAVAGGNGATTKRIDFAQQITILSRDGTKQESSCTGARVAVSWILTTATCLKVSGAIYASAISHTPPLRPMLIEHAGKALSVIVHPTRDIALIDHDSGGQPSDKSISFAPVVPAANEVFRVVGSGRTATLWGDAAQMHEAMFGVQAVTESSVTLSGVADASVCAGDLGAPVVRDDDGVARLVGLISSGTPGGCLGSSSTGHDATAVRVDGLEQWVKRWTLSSSFEPADLTQTPNTPVNSTSISNVGPVVASAAGPELGPRAERPHTGERSLLYSGKDNSASKSFAYLNAYDAQEWPWVSVWERTWLSYWIFPQSGPGTGAAGTNSTCVAVDLAFDDDTYLRDLWTYVSDGSKYQHHPAKQCGRLALNRWNKVDVPLGRVAEGKRVTRINVGYDQPANTGGYRGYVDDISFYYACSAVPGTVEKCTNGVVRPLRDGAPSTAKSVAVPRELSESAPGGDVSHLIENYRYPNADQVLAEHNVRLISGDGLIVMASCDDPPLQDIGVIRVYTSDISVNNGGQVCFKVLGSSRGLLTMEVPNVFEIRGDGQRPGAGHKVTATIKPEDGPQDTVVVDPDGSTQVGIGTAPPGPPTTLLELRVTS